ncbi:hypothetical protein BH18ACT4_BH18ACT4_14540 [soil metagenome]
MLPCLREELAGGWDTDTFEVVPHVALHQLRRIARQHDAHAVTDFE